MTFAKNILDTFLDEQFELTNLLDKLFIEYKIVFKSNITKIEFLDLFEVEFINKKCSNIFFINSGYGSMPQDVDEIKIEQICFLFKKFYENHSKR